MQAAAQSVKLPPNTAEKAPALKVVATSCSQKGLRGIFLICSSRSRACSKDHPADAVPASMLTKYPLYFDAEIEPNPVMKLDDNMMEAMKKMARMNAILEGLPGYDCGSCGSPTCRTFAEDIVRGFCTEMDCIHKLKDQLKIMAERMVELAQTKRE